MDDETAARRAEAAANPDVWRIGGSEGTHGRNVYLGTEHVAVFFSPYLAKQTVATLNAVRSGKLPALANVTANIGEAVKNRRQLKGLNLRQAGIEIGTNASTLSRVERGIACYASTYSKIVLWLGPDAFTLEPTDESAPGG